MKVLILVLSSVWAVSAFGLVLLRGPVAVVMAVVELQPIAPEETFQALEVSVPLEIPIETVSETVELPIAEPVVIPVVSFFKPVQTLEERRDAMLFESQALLDTPFDQSITMSFDNL